jgi:hypothetical protein
VRSYRVDETFVLVPLISDYSLIIDACLLSILIRPEGHANDETNEESLWKAVITEIRRRQDNFYIQVKWFYSPSELLKELEGTAKEAAKQV